MPIDPTVPPPDGGACCLSPGAGGTATAPIHSPASDGVVTDPNGADARADTLAPVDVALAATKHRRGWATRDQSEDRVTRAGGSK
jgi:hypothetical protein